jgi:hypothetical protein
MKKYSEEKKKMFRDKEEMKAFEEGLALEGSKVIKVGYMPTRTYRNFGYKYGVVYKKNLKKILNETHDFI